MIETTLRQVTSSWILWLGVVGWAFSAAADEPIRFLSEPAAGDAEEIARRYLRTHGDELGLSPADLDTMRVRDKYRTRHNGVTHIYFQQRLHGLEILNRILSINVSRDGRIINVGNRFIADLQRDGEPPEPSVTPAEALALAAGVLELQRHPVPEVIRRSPGPEQQTVFAGGGGLSQDEIPVKLAYFPLSTGRMRLVWDMVLRLPSDRHWYNLWLDATNGSFLTAHDWVGKLTAREIEAGAGLRPRYKVFALPLMNPDDGKRSVLSEPADPIASPYGWHDTDGEPGPEHTDTRGNNVIATVRRDGSRPDGGDRLIFDFPLDLEQPPRTYAEAAATNLFYWVNVLHDLHYHYGFDEHAGNFQLNNYGRGGVGGDPVLAFAQTRQLVTFSSPPDGLSPRMRLFIANPITAVIPMEHYLTVESESGPGDEYPAAGAYLGRLLDTRGVTGMLVAAEDGATGGGPAAGTEAPRPAGAAAEACRPLANEVAGKIVLVGPGGDCSVAAKARHVQQAGALAMVLVKEGQLSTVGVFGTGDDVEIPVVAIDVSAAESLKDRLGGGLRVTLRSDNDRVDRDSDLDSGVIIHEYGHGVANRLTGGPSAAGCLQAPQGLSLIEGTADFWAIALTAKPGDEPRDWRSITTYVFFQPPTGTGIRGRPYTTDMELNGSRFSDLPSFANAGSMVPHLAGVVWGSALWDVYWNLVGARGFDPDFVHGGGGNNLMLQLVMDGLKLQPCNPTYLEARDAILLADLVNTGGDNQCLLWRGFARRGMGLGAADKGDPNVFDVTAAYDVPADCRRQPAADDAGGDDDQNQEVSS